MRQDARNLTLTRDEAARKIRNAPPLTRFYVRAYIQAPIAGSPDMVFPTYASVNVTRREAERFTLDIFTEALEGRGARIPLEVHDWTREDSKQRLAFYIG